MGAAACVVCVQMYVCVCADICVRVSAHLCIHVLFVWKHVCVCVCVYVCVNACSSTTMLSCGLLSWLHLLLISLIQAALVFKLNFLCADIEHYCNAVDITCCLMSWFSCAISAACTQTALCLACSCPS